MQCYVHGGTNRVVQILHMGCYIHILLSSWCICGVCACGALCMLDMQCCVRMMLCTCWKDSSMYTWCCVHVVHMVLSTYDVVWMNIQVVLWACGVMYMYIGCYEHAVLCTCRACDAMYIWWRVHIMRVILCTCGIVYMLYSGVVYMLCCVHVAGGAMYMWCRQHVV